MKKLFLLLAGIAGIVLGASEIPQQKIQCGDTEITLVSRHYWNLNSIDYRGINLCRPRSFSAMSSVSNAAGSAPVTKKIRSVKKM